ncbi:MAG TPA: hypothetical protein VFK88_01690, partial [Gallionella sp.]|nr:hypothetical protein [Gallionella sp.]
MFNLVTENLNRPEPVGSGSHDTRIGLWRFVLATFFAAFFLSGSSTLPPGPAPAVPLPYISYRTDNAAQHRNLLVLLRGYTEDNTIFARAGIIEEVRHRHLPFDVIAPDANFGYYQTQTIETRLKEDIIDPARRQGYKHIWLAG